MTFTEGTTPKLTDTAWKTRQKMLMALNGGVGSPGAASSPGQTSALAGSEPASDGTVDTLFVYDSDTNFLWYNSGTVAAPDWKNV